MTRTVCLQQDFLSLRAEAGASRKFRVSDTLFSLVSAFIFKKTSGVCRDGAETTKTLFKTALHTFYTRLQLMELA